MKRLKEALTLYRVFFQIGLFTFGGGYAMLPLLERECVDKYHWCTKDELLDIFAIGQCTPGVIAVNTATFLGRKQGGFLGSAFATFGIVSPSLIIISLIAALLQNFADIPNVQHALAGVRVAVTALIITMTIKLIRSNWKRPLDVIIGVVAFIVVGVFGANPAIVVVGSGLVGLFYYGRFAKEKVSLAETTGAPEATAATKDAETTEATETAEAPEATESADTTETPEATNSPEKEDEDNV